MHDHVWTNLCSLPVGLPGARPKKTIAALDGLQIVPLDESRIVDRLSPRPTTRLVSCRNVNAAGRGSCPQRCKGLGGLEPCDDTADEVPRVFCVFFERVQVYRPGACMSWLEMEKSMRTCRSVSCSPGVRIDFVSHAQASAARRVAATQLLGLVDHASCR